MDYKCPTRDDLANIRALNRYFLVAVAEADREKFGELAQRRLTEPQLTCLAAAPFLLFSLREQDDEYWRHLLADDPQIDFVDSDVAPCEKFRHLQMAGLGFLWHLSRRSPYVSRIVSGAPLEWCERLANCTLARLLDRAATRADLLRIRFANEDSVWRRLLSDGIDPRSGLKRASHQFALQAMLTRNQRIQIEIVSAAACSMPDPVRRSKFRSSTGIREPKV